MRREDKRSKAHISIITDDNGFDDFLVIFVGLKPVLSEDDMAAIPSVVFSSGELRSQILIGNDNLQQTVHQIHTMHPIHSIQHTMNSMLLQSLRHVRPRKASSISQ